MLTDTLIWVIVVLCAMTVMNYLLIFGRSFIQGIRERRVRHIRLSAQHLLIPIFQTSSDIYDQESIENYLGQIARLAAFIKNNRVHQHYLRSELIASEDRFTGEHFHKVKSIFRELNFPSFTKKILHSKNDKLILIGLNECRAMHLTELKEDIEPLIYAASSKVRLNAYLALMDLSKDKLWFLKSNGVQLSRWEAMNIEEQLMTYTIAELPDFTGLLDHPNEQVRFFATAMINRFGQMGNQSIVPEQTFFPSEQGESIITSSRLKNKRQIGERRNGSRGSGIAAFGHGVFKKLSF